MAKKRVSNKVFFMVLVVAITLLSSVCFARWSYLVETSNGLSKTTTTLGRKALDCYGTTMVDGFVGAGVRVILQTLDQDGDWVTVTGWTDYHEDFAGVEEVIAVSDGTYRLHVQHTAYAEDDTDFSDPLEIHHSYSSIQTYP